MKRFISLALVLMLVLGCMPVSAETLEQILLRNNVSQETVDSLDTAISVPTDILEKFSTDAEYVDGPIIYTNGDTATVDMKAVVDLAPVKNAFQMYIAAGTLAAAGDTGKLDLVYNTKLTGEFVVNVTIPKGAVIPENYKIDPVGFSCAGGEWADSIYLETNRVYTEGTDYDTLEVTLKVVDPADNSKEYMTAKELEEKADFYFGTLEFTCPGIVITGEGRYEFEGTFGGYTVLGNELASIGYEAVQSENNDKVNEPLTAVVIIAVPGAPSRPTRPSTPATKVTLTFDPNGGELTDSEKITDNPTFNVDLTNIKPPVREGYEFTGWYYNETATQPVGDEIATSQNVTIYAGWVNVTAPDPLNAEDHEAYVIGYPEGDVRPENNITRAEVTTIFYRLLKDEVRDSIFTTENNFADVPAEFWASKAISTMSNGGYILGDAGTGMFRPDDSITRAEFAAIATRFLSNTDVEGYASAFSDISGHWAEDAIKLGASVGWIAGYEDGTFKPEQYITRAEAMTIINRVLVRYVDEAGLVDGYVKWPDNAPSQWYYYNVIEATNSHNYEREEGKHLEQWTEITENKVWVEKAEYEDPEA